jgi:predicted alpha-1,2-mannosidase
MNPSRLVLLLSLILIMSLAAGCGDDDEDNADDDDSTAGDDDDNDDDNDDTAIDDDDDAAPSIDHVNPFVGTGGLGYGFGALVPGPQTPNGVMRPSPDTSINSFAPGFQHYAGYWYADTHIRGFSHTRLVGTGGTDQGNIRFMPVLGIDDQLVTERGYRSAFSHDNENAAVGYYSVQLDDTGIGVELSALDFSAIHRYTYPEKSSAPYLIVDVGASITPDEVRDAWVQIDSENREVFGYADEHGDMTGRGGGLPTYFVARFSESFSDFGTFENGAIDSGATYLEGTRIGAYLGFETGLKAPVLATVGLSFISVEQARDNLDAEITDFDFDGVVEKNQLAWQEKLNLIEIEGGSEKQRRIFYTALYNAYRMPTLFTETGGEYLGFDDAVHTAQQFTYYTDMSLWDTFRTLHPLMTLIDPDLSRDFVVSLIRMYEQGGDLPRWPMGKGYTGSMIGTHADSVITEAYIKGVGDFDIQTAYEGMVRHATLPGGDHAERCDLEHYINLGYCTTDHCDESPSHTVEYAYDDHCISVLARELGYANDADMFSARAGNYANLWDPNTQFLRGRDSAGNWYTPFMPQWPFAAEYIEGDAWHWLWFVPHDPSGLIDLFGSAEAMTQKLEFFFQQASEMPNTFLPDVYYWHGNEPDIHAVYLFNHAGRPDLTQKWVRWIMEAKYKDAPDGLDGNDDGGTLSAWYILSSVGLFPMNPCSGQYEIGSPIFDEITLHLPGGDFTIIAQDNGPDHPYVQSAVLNDTALEIPRLNHEDLVEGGTLVLQMGPDPSNWGREPLLR